MKILLSRIVGLGLLLAMLQPAYGAFPEWYPKQGFEHYGTVDDVNAADNSVIVGDRLYFYSDRTVVHSLSETSDSLARLRTGVRIGFTYDENAKGQKQLIEIWLLPSNYSQQDDED